MICHLKGYIYNNKFCNYKKNNYKRNLLSNLPHAGEELLLIYV